MLSKVHCLRLILGFSNEENRKGAEKKIGNNKKCCLQVLFCEKLQ